ncbi:hypothetical protein [Amycolatopsis sp. NPDC051061]|uniref:hypothetical protein n=1 Tax=Amycolatopsis sp. NPDC051061 TaxID=3155042 RepID=UPI003425CE1A
MRSNVLAIFSVVAVVAAAAYAIQQSPNFTSQTTGLTILTVDAADYRSIVVPLPYREQPRTIQAPVPETEIATAWSGPEASGQQPESMGTMDMGPSPAPPSTTAQPAPAPTSTPNADVPESSTDHPSAPRTPGQSAGGR